MTALGRAESADVEDDVLLSAQAAVSNSAIPTTAACLDLARVYLRKEDYRRARQWAFAGCDAGDEFTAWLAAARIYQRCRPYLQTAARSARVAVIGSYTTSQFTSLLPLAGARAGIDVTCYESGYGQYRLDVLNPDSPLYSFKPDIVVLAVHDAEVALPDFSDDPEAAVENELARWTSLWNHIEARLGARVVQHNFAIPPEVSLGHLAARTPGSRYAMLRRLNERLGEAAADRVSIVDCDRLSAATGKHQWFDARYYHAAKQAVGLNRVAALARHTAAVIGAMLGLSKKVLVLDLDNTLWGGVLGEVGAAGVVIGSGATGEAFSAFQRYVLELKHKGVVLAICSKNNDADVREVFATNPDMLVRLEDIAVLMATWDDKPSAIRRIAQTLGVGLDSLVFVDDNPAEREAVRELIPEVDVIPLPEHPAGYVRGLSDYPYFESAALTSEDSVRTEQYRARAEAVALQERAGTVEDFLRSLQMRADIAALDAGNVARVSQLIGKTNQFNLTARRHGQADVEMMSRDGSWVTQAVRLKDRFADHGIIGVLLAREVGDALDIDTWLMSCRVIGRTVEDEMFWHLVETAQSRGCRRLLGTYVRTAKNAQVADLFRRLGFESTQDDGETTHWHFDLPQTRSTSSLITCTTSHTGDEEVTS